jgi:hypothetical protein
MSSILSILVRLVCLAALVAAYLTFVVPLLGREGDANIGAGLIGFVLVVVAAFVWAFLDARREPRRPTLAWWAVVAGLLGAGWVVLMAYQEADESTSVGELIAADAGLAVFVAGLVLVPAGIGTGIGRSTRSTKDEADQTPATE